MSEPCCRCDCHIWRDQIIYGGNGQVRGKAVNRDASHKKNQN